MNTKDLFRIFDACEPTVAQVQEYLERISGNSPFFLIFSDCGKEKITKKIASDMGELIGVIIENKVFYTKGMTKKDFNATKKLMVADVFTFGKNIAPKVLPMNKTMLDLLIKYRKDCEKLQDMLHVFGYSVSLLQDWYLLFDKPCDDTSADGFNFHGYCDRNTDISYFLTSVGNIFYCADWQITI